MFAKEKGPQRLAHAADPIRTAHSLCCIVKKG